MAKPRSVVRYFLYAAIGTASGYLLFLFAGFETELAVLFACVVTAGLAVHHRRRHDSKQLPPSKKADGAGVASDEEFLRLRWRQDLDYEAAGVRSPAVPSLDWALSGRGVPPEETDRTGRD